MRRRSSPRAPTASFATRCNTGTLLMGLATPLVLGSYWALLLLPPGWMLLVVRIVAEERLLSDRLRGYAAYLRRTRARLIPGVW